VIRPQNHPVKLKVLITTALAALATTTTGALGDHTRELEHGGNWQSFFVTRDDNSSGMCGMATFGKDKQGLGLSIMIKSQSGSAHRGDGIFFQLFKKGGWQFPKNQRVKVPVEVWFDKAHAFDADAFGYLGSTGPVVEFQTSDQYVIADFINSFRDAEIIYFRFREGNEGFWFASLTGSRAVADSFMNCLNVVNGKVPEPPSTQPYSPAPIAPTPPWASGTGTKPAPTAPTPPWASGTKPAAKKGDGSI
jgi:hypothetical protein